MVACKLRSIRECVPLCTWREKRAIIKMSSWENVTDLFCSMPVLWILFLFPPVYHSSSGVQALRANQNELLCSWEMRTALLTSISLLSIDSYTLAMEKVYLVTPSPPLCSQPVVPPVLSAVQFYILYFRSSQSFSHTQQILTDKLSMDNPTPFTTAWTISPFTHCHRTSSWHLQQLLTWEK